MGGSGEKKKSGLQTKYSDYAGRYNKMGVVMSHAVLETLLHAAGPLGGSCETWALTLS